MAKRIRLSAAASTLASRLYGRPWRILNAKLIAQDGLIDQDEREQWNEFYAALWEEVLLRLRNGEWRACRGCWRGAPRTAAVPIELWARRDAAPNLWRDKVSWAGGWIDELTLEVAEPKRAKARRASTEPTSGQNAAYDAFAAAQLPALVTRNAAIEFAESQGWPGGIGRKLWNDREKQPSGRPEKRAK